MGGGCLLASAAVRKCWWLLDGDWRQWRAVCGGAGMEAGGTVDEGLWT